MAARVGVLLLCASQSGPCCVVEKGESRSGSWGEEREVSEGEEGGEYPEGLASNASSLDGIGVASRVKQSWANKKKRDLSDPLPLDSAIDLPSYEPSCARLEALQLPCSNCRLRNRVGPSHWPTGG